MFDKIVVITKKTALEELVEKFNSREQAKFYIEHSGLSFAEYDNSHIKYQDSLERLKKAIVPGIKTQFIERSFLPNFLFGEKDLVITLGPDGLVVNAAKYLNGQFILAVNPDPERIDGILLPINAKNIKKAIETTIEGKFQHKLVSMAAATLNDGQLIYGFNDIFIGPKSHISMRYSIEYRGASENQCSSGIIVSTGAGSTGWFKSILCGSRGICGEYDNLNTPDRNAGAAFEWDSDHLYFAVREPFESKNSKTKILFGKITQKEPIGIYSQMPSGGVIFSDGVESDHLEFNSGKIAVITLANKKVKLINRIL